MTKKTSSYPETFLAQVRVALENADELVEAINNWVSKYRPPEIIPDQKDWEVDEETFRRFEKVVNFLRMTIFGVHDRSSLVYVACQDRTRDDCVLPDICVPKTPMDASLKEVCDALEAARMNASAATRLVESLEGQLMRRLRQRFAAEDRKFRARDCETCKGKGWVRDVEAYKALGPGEQGYTRSELGGYNRVFCDCQKKDPEG